MWKARKVVCRTFPSVERVMVKNVWRGVKNGAISSLRTFFDKLDLKVEFNWG
jgi:hypothetical protein